MFHSCQLFTEKMQYFLFEFFIWECYQSGHGTDAQVISTGGSIFKCYFDPILALISILLLLGRHFRQSKPQSSSPAEETSAPF